MRLKYSLLLGLSIIAFLFIVSCVPVEENGERGAVAGLAISKGCYDADNDGYGRSGRSISACSGSKKMFDCDDTNTNVNPSITEICGNRIDDNCNKRIDEAGCIAICTDTDGDNITTRGTVTGLDYNRRSIISSEDGCTETSGGAETESGSYVVEGTCLADGRINSEYIRCPFGTRCQAGRCVTLPAPDEICDYDGTCGIDDSGWPCTSDWQCQNDLGQDYICHGERETCISAASNGQCGSLLVGETNQYTVNGINYDVTIPSILEIGDGEYLIGVVVNEESMTFAEMNTQSLPDGNMFTLRSVFYQDYAGGVHAATFCITLACYDNDASAADPYTASGFVSVPGTLGVTIPTFADYCDPSGTDIFEQSCDGQSRITADYSCGASGSGYSCLDPDGEGGQGAYCGLS